MRSKYAPRRVNNWVRAVSFKSSPAAASSCRAVATRSAGLSPRSKVWEIPTIVSTVLSRSVPAPTPRLRLMFCVNQLNCGLGFCPAVRTSAWACSTCRRDNAISRLLVASSVSAAGSVSAPKSRAGCANALDAITHATRVKAGRDCETRIFMKPQRIALRRMRLSPENCNKACKSLPRAQSRSFDSRLLRIACGGSPIRIQFSGGGAGVAAVPA